MSLNNLPQPTASPDYIALVHFLVEPFLVSPEGLKLDYETAQGGSRVWLRLALEGEDKGRLFGRWGKNIQSIRTLLQMAAAQAGQSLHLEVYGESKEEQRSEKRYSESREHPPSRPSKSGDNSSRPTRTIPPIRRST